jgi:hypothetical protein
VTIALATTNTQAAAMAEKNFNQQTFARIAEYLTPGHPSPFGQ